MEGETPTCDVDRSRSFLRNSFVSNARTVDALDRYLGSNVRRVRRETHPLRYSYASIPATTPTNLATLPETGGYTVAGRSQRRPRRIGQPARAESPESAGEFIPHSWSAQSYYSGSNLISPHYRATSNHNQGNFETTSDFPYFDGYSSNEDYLEWEYEVDSFFNNTYIFQEKQARYVIRKLTGRAKTWWALMVQARHMEGRSEVRTWRKMKQLLRGQFLTSDYEISRTEILEKSSGVVKVIEKNNDSSKVEAKPISFEIHEDPEAKPDLAHTQFDKNVSEQIEVKNDEGETSLESSHIVDVPKLAGVSIKGENIMERATLGDKETIERVECEFQKVFSEARDIIGASIDGGINSFDTAEAYGVGFMGAVNSETLIRSFIKGRQQSGPVEPYVALLHYFCDLDRFSEAISLLEEVLEKDNTNCSSLITGVTRYYRNAEFEKALSVFKQESVHEMCLDLKYCSELIDGLCLVKKIQEAIEVFYHIVSRGCSPSINSLSMLNNVVCDMGKEEDAPWVFDSIQKYSVNECSYETLSLFSEMITADFKPNLYKLTNLFKSLILFSSFELSKFIHGFFVKSMYESDKFVANALIEVYAKCTDVESINKIVLGLYHKNNMSLFEEGRSLFSFMSEDQSTELSMEHYTCMVNLFGCSAHFNKAMKLIREIPFQFCVMVWSALLGACLAHKNDELVNICVEKAFEIEPQDELTHVLMSNMLHQRQPQPMARIFSASINPARFSNDLPIFKVPQLFFKNLPENFSRLSYGARRSYIPFTVMATSVQPQCSRSVTHFINSQPSIGVLEIWCTADAVCFDVDSIVCLHEGIDELADYCGAGKAVSEWTNRAMSRSIPFEETLAARLSLFRSSLLLVQNFLSKRPPRLLAGIAELINKLKTSNTNVYLIYGGFLQMIEPIAVQHIRKVHGYKSLIMIRNGAIDVEARMPGGVDLFICYGRVHEGSLLFSKWEKANIISTQFTYSSLLDCFYQEGNYWPDILEIEIIIVEIVLIAPEARILKLQGAIVIDQMQGALSCSRDDKLNGGFPEGGDCQENFDQNGIVLRSQQNFEVIQVGNIVSTELGESMFPPKPGWRLKLL